MTNPTVVNANGRIEVGGGIGSRLGIISRNGDGYYFVPTVNRGETVVRGARSFSTLKSAIKAASKFVTHD